MADKPTYEELEEQVRELESRMNAMVVEQVRDAADIRLAKVESRKRSQFLESVLYHAPDAIITLDPQHRVIDWNPGAVNLFGYTADEARGRNLDDLISRGRHYTEASDITRKVLSGNRLEGFETVRYRKDGSPVDVIAAGSPILIGDVLAGVLAVYTDITELKKIEAERRDYETRIQQMQKMEAIGTLAGGIAHDFNNILSGVIGYAELSLSETRENTRLRENLSQILVAAKRAGDLVRQILAFSRQSERDLKPLRIGPLVKEALRLLRSSLPATIEIRAQIDPDVDTVLADPTQVHQIIMNLCTNAAQAMEEDVGTLTVSLSQVTLAVRDLLDMRDLRIPPGLKPGIYNKLSVQDTGAGISPDILDKIYHPYFTTKERDKGTGLGLAVVHGIVQGYSGFITVSSRRGHGSIFEVYIPAIKRSDAVEHATAADLPVGSEHILLVDDEQVLIDVTKRMLATLGYHVRVANSGMEALEIFQRSPEPFDLVLTDMTMPGMSGKRLAGEIRAVRPDIPIILSTGYSDRLTDSTAQDLNLQAILLKPVQLAQLAQTVRRVLDTGLSP